MRLVQRNLLHHLFFFLDASGFGRASRFFSFVTYGDTPLAYCVIFNVRRCGGLSILAEVKKLFPQLELAFTLLFYVE